MDQVGLQTIQKQLCEIVALLSWTCADLIQPLQSFRSCSRAASWLTLNQHIATGTAYIRRGYV